MRADRGEQPGEGLGGVAERDKAAQSSGPPSVPRGKKRARPGH
jgi:hypothetical protein